MHALKPPIPPPPPPLRLAMATTAITVSEITTAAVTTMAMRSPKQRHPSWPSRMRATGTNYRPTSPARKLG